MSDYKTTAFYEMQIRRILQEYGVSDMKSTLRDDLKMLIKDANSPDFKEWFNSKKSGQLK